MKPTLRSFIKDYYLKSIVLLFVTSLLFHADTRAQTTISTLGSFTNDSSVSTVTFNFQNTNSYPVMITDMEGILSTYGNVGVNVFYKTSAINGPTGIIDVSNSWVAAGNAVVLGVENTSTLVMQPLLSGLSITVPANSTYGIAISASYAGAAALRVGNGLASFTVGAGGCNVINGTNTGYATTAVLPAAPDQSPRAWLGRIKFISAVNCTGTPNVTTVSGPASICSGSLFQLSANGYSVGAGIQYQWQKYNTTTLVWDDIAGAVTPLLSGNITVATQYRFKTTCSATSTQTTSPSFTVTIGAALPGGNYTINKNAASSPSNFVSFRAAAEAMKCGITGSVNLNVVPNSGPYTERVVFSNIPGASATSQIRINGNGNVMQSSANSSIVQDSLYVIHIKGAKYLTIDSLTIRTLNVSYGMGIVFSDTAAFDTVKHCFLDLRSITGPANIYNAGISLSGYYFSGSVYEGYSSNLYIGYNHILGTFQNNGMYAGILSNYGSYYADDNDTGIVIVHNDIENFSYYGIQANSGKGTLVAYNDIHRDNKVNTNNFIGIVCWMGQYNNLSTPNINDEIKIIGNRIHHPRALNQPQATTTVFAGIQIYNYYYNGVVNDSTNLLIANNAIYGIANTTVSGNVWGIYTQTGNSNVTNNNDNIRIYHNTIDFSGLNTTSSNVAGIYCYDYYYNGVLNNDSIRIKNNLVTLSGSSTQPCFGFTYGVNGTNVNVINEIEAKRNVFYNIATPVASQFYGRVGTVNYPTLASFQAAYPGYEAGSVSVDPQYLAPANGDFTPQNALLYANGVNVLVDVPLDINGRPRSPNPTPGAFEIGADAGATNLLAPVGTYCSSVKMVQVSVKNYGLLPITGLQVNWSLNGVIQTPVVYSSTLNPNASAAVSLGNGLFMPNTPVTIKAWTSAPNGQYDGNPLNDTLTITTQSSTSVPVNIGPDDSICVGSTLTLDAGYAGSTYLWDNNTTAQTRTIQNAGTYYVRLTAFDGCIGVDTMKLTLRPLPVVDLGPDVEICEGSTYTFDAGHPGSTYHWDDGSTMQTRTVDTAGDYEAQVTDIHGCMGVDNVSVTMKDIPSVDGLNATHADSGFYTFYPLNPRYIINYSWDFGDGSPHGIGYMVQHQYAHNGIYTVTLYMEGECTGLIVDKSRTVDVFNAIGGSATGVNGVLPQGMISMYPNPANNQLHIENASAAKMKNVSVYNVLGQRIIAEKANAPQQHKLNTMVLSSGIYSIRIETDQGMYVQKFEVIR